MRDVNEAERLRRRDRTQNGRSPAQRTTRSKVKTRAAKYPGANNRAGQQQQAIREQ